MLGLVCVAAMGTSLALAGWPGGLAAAALVPVLAAIAVIDARHFIIPDGLNAAGLVLGLAYAATAGASPLDDVLAALARGGGLALLFLALRLGYRMLRGRDGLGLGDVKLAAVAGVWLEVEAMPIAIEIAALAGLIAYGLRQMGRGGAARSGPTLRGRDRLPFGLFFAPAIWMGWVLDRGLLASW